MAGHACALVEIMLKIGKVREVGVSPCFSTMGFLSLDEVILDSHSLSLPLPLSHGICWFSEFPCTRSSS